MGIASVGLRVLRNYKQLMFNPKYSENITKHLCISIRNNKKAGLTGLSKYKNLGSNTKEAVKFAERRAANTSIRAGIKAGLGEFKTGWKLGKGFLGKSKGILKALGKNIPLIGSVLLFAFELPNIIGATKDKGLLAGIGETLKAGGRLGAGMGMSAVGAAIGSAFIPPVGSIVGGLVGWFAGDWVFSKFFGKSYSEKKMEVAQHQAEVQAEVQNQVAQIMSDPQFRGLYASQMNQTTPNFQGTLQSQMVNPYASMAMNPQLMAMQSQLYGKNSYSDDIMFNQTFGNQGLNMIG